MIGAGEGGQTPGNGGSSWRPNSSGVPGQLRPSHAGTLISRGKFTMFKNPRPGAIICVFGHIFLCSLFLNKPITILHAKYYTVYLL